MEPLEDEMQKQKLMTNGRRDEEADSNAANIEDPEDFEDEQNLVARLVHLVHNEDVEIHFNVSFTGGCLFV
jgi:hypothetical protein